MNVILKVIFAAGLFLCSFSALPASTKQDIKALQEAIVELKEAQVAMQKDLAEIKKQVKNGARAAPAKAAFREQEISIGDSPVIGEANATVTLIEFSDYQCPFCARHFRDVMPQIVKDYVDTGKVKYVMFENPITSLHRNAYDASLAALCAKDQGKYWEMHDVMFANQKKLSVDSLKSFAASIGLNSPEFDTCLDSKKYEKQIDSDLSTAAKLSVRGTPGFVLGLTDSKDPNKVKASVYIKGAQRFDRFKADIEQLLDSAK